MSTPKLVKCGVPKGTIPGPLLFLLYINDQPDCLYFSQPRMYADDTSLTFAGVDSKHIDDCLNYDLNRVYKWPLASKLTLNLTKTEFMLVASRQKLSTFPEIPSFSLTDHSVRQVSSTKSLGGHIDQNMNWECHIQNMCKKIAIALGQSSDYDILYPLIIIY